MSEESDIYIFVGYEACEKNRFKDQGFLAHETLLSESSIFDAINKSERIGGEESLKHIFKLVHVCPVSEANDFISKVGKYE